MKKAIFFLASMLVAIAAIAGSETPNRLFVQDNAGNYKGFVLNRIDSISFGRVEGEVKANVEITKVACDTLWLSAIRTAECRGFKIAVVPGSIAKQLTNPLYAINYVNRENPEVFYQDFTSGILSGISLNANSEYAVVTVGIDKYGIECDVDIKPFKTPAPAIVGDPKVSIEVLSTTLKTFNVKFIPNDDVLCYYVLAGKKGEMQSQYEFFGPMFGLTSFEHMIKSWGVQLQGEGSHEWTGMAPNTEYEVFVCCMDQNENLAPYQVFSVSTNALGGSGEAKVDITLGEYKPQMWGEEVKPSQFLTFTPNDQCSAYRIAVYKAEIYDAQKDQIHAELCSEPPMPMAYWFQYDALTTDFQIDPSTSCVAIAAGKNANDQWGAVTELRFTTADTCGTSTAVAPMFKGGKIIGRTAAKSGVLPFTAPAAKKAIELRQAM